MNRFLPFALLAALAALAHVSRGDVPAPQPKKLDAALPVGTWRVEFNNGVVEMCEIRDFEGGQASVDEPLRRSGGRISVEGGALVITFDDDRVERWTSVGTRFVVEHWFPGSSYPTGKPVLGIAERSR